LKNPLLVPHRRQQSTITPKNMIRFNLAYEAARTADSSDIENDADLVRKAQAGDLESLEILLCKHWPAFCRHAQKAFNGRPGTQDIRQEACLKAIRCLANFVVGRSFPVWVYGFIDNEVRHRQRNSKIICTRSEEIGNYIIETMSANAENKSEADERELLSFLSKRAAQLAKAQRASAMFMLSQYARLREFPTVRAIAQTLHISQGAAQINRNAVLASFRHILTGSEFEIHIHHE
jgi:RNA polymerase sigma factor (sigma-70 family)